jgi:Na+/H+ antiporter NhaD/arsenite permease-like protein
MLVPLLIFLATYLVLALGRAPVVRVDRTGAAIIGAILMIVAGGVPLEEAYRAIDYRTLVLLFGMMVLVANLRLALFFRVLAQASARRIASPAWLLVTVVFASGLLAALFVNDTICLVFTPVLIEVARARGQRPLPYLLALATAANLGSAAAITGNPQNMLIGSVSGISYVHFTSALGPVALAGLAIDAAVIYLLFRRELAVACPAAEALPIRSVHRALMTKSLVVAALVLAGFLAGFDPALVAACGAAVLLVTRRVKPERIYAQIDWGLLVLFVGLFIVVHGIERSGLDHDAFAVLKPIGLTTTAGLSIVSALLSNLVSNVPAVMLFTRIVPHLPDPGNAWLVLAMSSTVAGNLTLLGSIANLIVAEGAARHGVRVTFWEYLKVGLPVTLLTLALGTWWLSK